ncbi:MAG: DUF2336 domain-containing protein [Tardiphaga sp.]
MATKPTMSAHLLDELQTALAHGTVARRVETLRRVTDLFMDHAVDYSSEQLAVFDDVFECLIRQIETTAKQMLAERLAPVANAPTRIIRTLAFDDQIAVAAPVLSQSERLDDKTLIENARTKSQNHLMAISTRKTLSGAVTAVLVACGDDEVVKSTARNPGAAFSNVGFTTLLSRAETDDEIATTVGSRADIPRHFYLRLIAKASASVQARLGAAHPRMAEEVSLAVREASHRARVAPGGVAEQTTISHHLVRSLFEDGRLDENEVAKFAQAGKFDEANAAIACLANVPVAVAETMMVEVHTEGIFILAKVAKFSWPTVAAIMQMRETLSGVALTDSAANRDIYERLRLTTAQQVLRFHRMQQATAVPPAA